MKQTAKVVYMYRGVFPFKITKLTKITIVFSNVLLVNTFVLIYDFRHNTWNAIAIFHSLHGIKCIAYIFRCNYFFK